MSFGKWIIGNKAGVCDDILNPQLVCKFAAASQLIQPFCSVLLWYKSE